MVTLASACRVVAMIDTEGRATGAVTGVHAQPSLEGRQSW